MPSPTPSWEFYRTFLAVLREGSLSGAARNLALTQPTVGRHVDALEAGFGAALFTRSPGGLQPTPAALALAPHAERMEAAAEALLRAASGEAAEERGTVRLTASDIVGGEVLPPMLARFRERHPRITIELVLSNRSADLLRRDADIAVRMARPKQAALVARRIGCIAIGLFAHRRYAAAHGLPQSLDELKEHALIGFDRDTTSWRRIERGSLAVTRELFAFRCDSDLAQLAALRAGYGIGGCQRGIAARESELVPVLPKTVQFTLEMWLAMHEDLRASRRVRLFFDHLVRELGDYVALASPA